MTEASSVMPSRRALCWSWLGRRSYGPTFALQEEIRRRVKSGEGPERFLLLEHEPVFTLGRNASEADVVADPDWLRARGVEVFESNRGGQVTYHGPGQLVGYPIVNLSPDRRDIGKYVRDLQEVIIRAAAEFGVEARRREGKEFIGVWAENRKIASIGVHLSRWVTLHGFALNVTTNLEHFDGIVACGLKDVTMTSMVEQGARDLDPRVMAPVVARHFAEIFDREATEMPASELASIEAAARPVEA